MVSANESHQTMQDNKMYDGSIYLLIDHRNKKNALSIICRNSRPFTGQIMDSCIFIEL